MNNGGKLMMIPNGKGYIYSIGKNRRMEINRVGPDAITVHVFRRDGRGRDHTYLFEIKDKEDIRQGDAMESILIDVNKLQDAVNEKDIMNSATDRWKRHLRRSILLVATYSKTIDNKMREVYQREAIDCPDEAIPRIKRLIIRLFTIPEPQHVMEMAKKKGMSLSSDDVARICWGIHAFERALEEFREKGRMD